MSRAERLDRILEAGAAVLSERGYHGATMRDVAREAGVSLATVYHYVGGRDDLLYRVQVRILDAAVASAEAALAARGARDRLKALVTDHLRRVLRRPAEAAVLAGPLGPLRGERGRRVEDLRRAYVRLLELTIDGATRRTGSRARDRETQAWMLMGMMDRLALTASRDGSQPQPGRLASRVLSLFLEGARGPRSRRGT